MRRLFLLIVALVALASSVVGQARHPFTFEDMMKLKRVGEPQVSPDGKWVIFSVVDVDLEANTKTPHVWIVPLDADSHVSQNQGDMGHPNESGVPHVSPNSRDVGKAGVGTGASPVQAERSSAGSSTAERILISDQDADRPRWAPDGKRFAFLSTKEGGAQVWIADFDDAAGTVTAVHKLTSIATEAGGELWSPDGTHILFTSDVYPACDISPSEELLCNELKSKEAESSKVKALIFDRLLYRHWNAYKAGKRSHLLLTPVPPEFGPAGANAWPVIEGIRDLTPGDYDAPEFSLGGQDDYAFSPDGQEICYTSNHDKVEATSTNNDLWIVPVSVGAGDSPAQIVAKTKNITADNPASDSTPLYSPDGKYIAYRAQQRPGYESDRFRLILYDRKTGKKKNLTENFDYWVGSFTWIGKSLLFSAEYQGAAPIFYTDVDGQQPSKIFDGFNDDLTGSPFAKPPLVLFTRMSLGAPTEIFGSGLGFTQGCGDSFSKGNDHSQCTPVSAVPYGPMRQFTHFNDAILSQVSMSPLEPFWFTGAHGDKVQGFLVKPPNFDAAKKYPVKFLVHGGPQGAWGDDWSYRWNPELFAANGYVVVMINFHGSTGYGQKFIDSINGDWGGGPFEDLMKGLDYAEEHYPFIDKTRECALGASFGGYMINWIAGHTDRFKCLVSHDGSFNNESDWATTDELWFNNWEFHGTPYTNRDLYLKWSPHMYARNFKTPTLVIHGQLDYRLDVSEGFQMFDTLQMMGVPSKMLYFPDEGHWVLKPQNARLWYKTVNDWVDRWTKDQGTK